MICDFDDFCEDNNRLDLLIRLKGINPAFKCTLFAIPAKCSLYFTAVLPHWIRLGVHGWGHDTNTECLEWTKEQTINVMKHCENQMGFVKIWKSPGWQSSKGVREACIERGYIYADNPHYKKDRLPGERIYDHTEYPDSWHGHIQNTCGNGLEETWDRLVERVRPEREFRFISEVVK